MEEILASIRRIISEDEPESGEPLELSKPAPPPPMTEPTEDATASDLLIFDREPEEPEPEPVRAAPTNWEAPAPRAAVDAETLISEPVVAQAASAFTRLAGTLRIAEMQGQTLEGIVRDMLSPMLRDWLEAHLPAIVEAKVEAELERIARLSR